MNAKEWYGKNIVNGKRGINLFLRKSDDCFIFEDWSNWQKESSGVEVMTRKEAIDYLLSNASINHPRRVNDAFETIGYIPKIF